MLKGLALKIGPLPLPGRGFFVEERKYARTRAQMQRVRPDLRARGAIRLRALFWTARSWLRHVRTGGRLGVEAQDSGRPGIDLALLGLSSLRTPPPDGARRRPDATGAVAATRRQA